MASEEKTRQKLVDAVRKADNAISGSLELQVNRFVDEILPLMRSDKQKDDLVRAINIVFRNKNVPDFYLQDLNNPKELKKKLEDAIWRKYSYRTGAMDNFLAELNDSIEHYSENHPILNYNPPISGALQQVGLDKIQQAFDNLDASVTAALAHHGVEKLSDADNEHTKNVVRVNIINSLTNAIENGHYDIALKSKSFAAIKDMNPFETIAPIMLENMANGGGDKIIGLLQDKEFVKILESLDVANIYPIAHFVAYLPSHEGRGEGGVRFRYTPYGFSNKEEDIVFKQILGNKKIKSTLSEWIKSPRQKNEGMETDSDGYYTDDRGYYTRQKLEEVINKFEKSQQPQLPQQDTAIPAIENKQGIKYTPTFRARENHRKIEQTGWGRENE